MPREVLDNDRVHRWEQLLDAQSGMVHTGQLAAFGVTSESIRAQVEGRRWNGYVRSVYATFTGPPPRESRIAGALLYGGSSAILSHRTAAEEWRMLVVTTGPVHITVPYTSSAVSQPDEIVVHRSRAHPHIAVPSVPPRTTRADTAVDLAVAAVSAREAMVLLLTLMTDHPVRPVEVEQRIVERPPRRYRRALLDAVRLVRDGVQSALEELFATRVELAHGLPTGTRQVPVVVDGVTMWEDVTYDASGFALTVRLDGRTHIRADVAFRDRRRDNAAELAGRARLVFGWRDLSADPCAGAREVAAVLRRLGWTGRLAACTSCL
ncbi:hypothetical protein WIS52_22600 [Pseudonocardia nematodicida]|uniref:Transcriptional regulator, AbiEi antitoxin, Type IV TA system n=1 Tax=Pseudonocardia nematodicida TaxID=1206997 RepID=A0ABV1KFN0_9PSEU